MKICVMGAGGLGGFFGGFLAAAGEDVSFIARGPHLEAIRANGLTITSALGDRHVADVTATGDPAEIGPVDIVLFCVKNYDLDQAAEAIRPLLKPDTAVISLLNGVDAPERLDALLGPGHAVAGITFTPANIVRPGVIAHYGDKAGLTFGEATGAPSPRLTAFRDACRAAGLEAEVSTDITAALWAKYAGWSAVGALLSATRGPFGPVQSSPELMDLLHRLLTETCAVGRAQGVDLPEDLPDNLTALVRSFAPETKNSMLVDLEQGKRLELEYGCGKVMRLGEELGVDTPANRTLYAILRPYRDGQPSTAASGA